MNKQRATNKHVQLEAGDQHLGGFSIPANNKFIPKTTQTPQQTQVETEITQILQQLRSLLDRAHQAAPIKIQEALLNEFSYVFEQENSAWNNVKTWASKLARTLGVGATVVLAVKDAWDQINAIPENTPIDVKQVEIRKIVATVTGQYGVSIVSGILGAIMGSAVAGPIGTVIGGVGGAVAADVYLGNDIDEMVDKIIEHLYPNAHAQIEKNSSTVGISAEVSNLIKELQTVLGVEPTGILDDATIRAMQQDLHNNGAANVQVTGNVDWPTLVAIKNVYF